MISVKVSPKFAVLLAAYNGMEYISEQINSILLQEDVDVRIFVSIDQSTDGTENYLINLANVDSRITLLPLGQVFGAASPNFYRLMSEVELSGFDYLCFSDQDDIWHPEKLIRAHHSLIKNKADGYSGNVNAFWPSGKTKLVDKAQPQKSWDFLFEAAGPGCTYVLNKHLALSFQNVVRSYESAVIKIEYHDWLTYAFARANNFRWVIDDFPNMQYRQHQNNQIGVNIGWRPLVARVQKMLNGHGFAQVILIADLLGLSSAAIPRLGLRRGRLGYLWLALHARQCRRKGTDQLHFFILCILSFALNPLVDVGHE